MSSRRACRVRQNVFVFLFLFGSIVAAEPLYLEQVRQADVSEKTLQKSLQQMKEYKEIKIIDDLSIPPFHKRRESQVVKNQPFCLTCHLPLPHREDKRSRTFMNMHSRYVACETCHFRPKKTSLVYRWLAYDGVDAGNAVASRNAAEVIIEPPILAKRKHKAQFKKRVPLAPQWGARISPFYNDAPVLLFKDSPFVQKVAQEWKDADKIRRAEIKARIHAPLRKEGPACKKCHGKRKPMLDLKMLGATPMQLKAIQNNIIVRFFDRFKKEKEYIRIDKLLR